MKKLLLLSVLLPVIAHAELDVKAQAVTPVGRVHQSTMVYGNYEYSIRNTTYKTIEYSYTVTLCPEHHHCREMTNKIKVPSQGVYKSTVTLGRDVKYGTPGQYQVSANIYLTGGSEYKEKKIIKFMRVYS